MWPASCSVADYGPFLPPTLLYKVKEMCWGCRRHWLSARLEGRVAILLMQPTSMCESLSWDGEGPRLWHIEMVE